MTLAAFHRLYRLENQVKTVCDEDRLYVLGASNGSCHAVMIANLTGAKKELSIEGINEENARYYVIDNERLLSWAPHAKTVENNDVVLIEWQD